MRWSTIFAKNAIKYNKEGGEIRVWVGNTLNGKKIIVTDTGIGIPKKINKIGSSSGFIA